MLNQQQQKAKELIINFIKNNEKSFTLSGFAGTGKTFLIKNIVNELNIKYVFTALTYKALENLGEGMTIHKLLGLGLDVDVLNFNPDVLKFSKKNDCKIDNYDLIIVDECSMISQSFYDLIMSYNKKIIFLGDSKQLPPINENLSPTFKNIDYELTIIERTNISNIQKLCNDIRNNCEKHITNYECENIKVIKKEDYDFSCEKIIAYTNAQVNYWNEEYRKHHKLNGIVSKNDILVSLKPIKYEFGGYYFDHKINTNFKVLKVNENNDYIIAQTNLLNLKIVKNIDLYNEEKKKIIDSITNKKLSWQHYYNVFKLDNLVLGEDLSFYYSITVHKAQGSTFNSIAVDYNDLSKSDIFRSLLYVSLSRAKNKIIILI